MFRSIYVETKANIPFSTHNTIVQLQQHNGIKMGTHHYERTSATRMVELISATMHDILLGNLVRTNLPLSIILDG
jgi:hypothetical protein